MRNGWRLPFGANAQPGGGVSFRVWAPGHDAVHVVTYGPDAEAAHPLASEGDGWFGTVVPAAGPGTRYRWRLADGATVPDPVSRAQPDGVHEPSEVVDPWAFPWTDGGWAGVPLDDWVIYELHVGTFTPEGTFDAAARRLDDLAALGVTAVELMPVAAFPGARNWGYDGVHPFAPAAPYGGPEGLRRFVDAAHARGLAVVLDVVYNHLGPEGNYLPAVTGGRFFTERHHTPWGAAVNFDGPDAAAVREFVVQNALHWVHEYHVDGLRLDATHAILDDSPETVLAELARRVRAGLAPGRHFALVAEDERNERRLVLPPSEGGTGLDAVWADDFHHEIRVLATGEREGYFADFAGTAASLAAVLERGWTFEGQETPSHGRARGTPAGGLPPRAFVHCIQNHDQVGNRAFGDRLTESVSLPVYRAMSALLLLSPYTPLLWMGQEWAATSPFPYFTDHPEELGRLVTEGRRKEFERFPAFRDPAARDRIPDPQAPETFLRAKLAWGERLRDPHAGILALYRELLALRRSHPALRERRRASFASAAVGEKAVALRRTAEDGAALLLVCSLEGGPRTVETAARDATRAPEGRGWRLLLATEEGRFGGAEGVRATLSAEGALTLAGAGAVLLEAE